MWSMILLISNLPGGYFKPTGRYDGMGRREGLPV